MKCIFAMLLHFGWYPMVLRHRIDFSTHWELVWAIVVWRLPYQFSWVQKIALRLSSCWGSSWPLSVLNFFLGALWSLLFWKYLLSVFKCTHKHTMTLSIYFGYELLHIFGMLLNSMIMFFSKICQQLNHIKSLNQCPDQVLIVQKTSKGIDPVSRLLSSWSFFTL